MKMEKLKPKKSLGQNFLRDEKVIEQIIESADLNLDDVILEVGPGEGVLTEKLAPACGRLIAIELDDRLIEMLRNKLRNNSNVEIIHGDILKLNLAKLFHDADFLKASEAKSYKLVANLPYYITSPIIRYFLENEIPPDEMILMVQKEVAERIVAKPGQMSILAVSVQYYAEAEYLFTVKRDSFEPAPKVDSAVIKITRYKIQDTRYQDDIKSFFRVVKAGFSAKRKTLANNLSNSLHRDKKEVEDILGGMGFSKSVRAQELSVEDWKRLTISIGHSS